MVPDVGYQLAIHGADGACDGVENVALQRREDICGEILAPRTDDEIGDVFDNVSIRHGHLFVMGIYSSWASIRHGPQPLPVWCHRVKRAGVPPS
jgi:hypothetical protein